MLCPSALSTDPPAQHQGPRLLCPRHSAPFSRGQPPEVLPLLRPAMMLRPQPHPHPLAPPPLCPALCSDPHCTPSLAACDWATSLHTCCCCCCCSTAIATVHAAVAPPSWEPQRKERVGFGAEEGENEHPPHDFQHCCLQLSSAQRRQTCRHMARIPAFSLARAEPDWRNSRLHRQSLEFQPTARLHGRKTDEHR